MAESTSKKRAGESGQSLEGERLEKKQKMGTLNISDPGSVVYLVANGDGDAATFIVPKEIACHYSPVLAKELVGDVTEWETAFTTGRALKLLVQWFYSQRITVRQLEGEWRYNRSHSDEDLTLVELWILARRLEIPALQDLVIMTMDDIYKKCDIFPVNCVSPAYEATVFEPQSKLRGFLIALYVHCYPPDHVMWGDEELPREFLVDLVLYLGKRVNAAHRVYSISTFLYEVEG
ncbi:hypothetical protein BDZ45DRAFT_750650 [Acephala macrosclerotiorum]|nr:hypothetical protein BDZ45DRAFT_750650 [Acephala macrosclerotiorum]